MKYGCQFKGQTKEHTIALQLLISSNLVKAISLKQSGWYKYEINSNNIDACEKNCRIYNKRVRASIGRSTLSN